jgi:hypothetical protein
MSPATNWDQWGRCLRGVPFFQVTKGHATLLAGLLFNPLDK